MTINVAVNISFPVISKKEKCERDAQDGNRCKGDSYFRLLQTQHPFRITPKMVKQDYCRVIDKMHQNRNP